MALSTDLIRYLEGLIITGGDRDGEPFQVLGWQRRFVKGCFSRSGDACVSVGRGNGKSALVAGIAAAVVDPRGPLHGTRREVVCCAASFEQSRIIYEDVLHYLRSAGFDLDERLVWRRQDSANRAHLEYRRTGARVRCIGSDPKTAHGLRPYLALLDEPAQWEPSTRDRMLAAVRTGLGKVPNSRLIALGTRPASAGHWFARMLEGGAGYAQTHAAGRDDPPFQVRTWKRANPSLSHFPSLRAQLVDEAEKARTDPSMMAAFRALRLNMGVADEIESMLLDADTWAGIEGHALWEGPSVWGVDLGTSAAQSAIASYWPDTGALAVVAAFPSVPSLADRGLADAVGSLYVDCFERGELIQCGGAAADVRELVDEALSRFGVPAAVAADRWREAELRDVLQASGVPPASLVLRGMGFVDGAQDVRSFRRACLEGRVTPEPSLLVRSAMGEARVVMDAAGNAKLSKGNEGGRRLKARDDAAAAAILAVAVGSRRPKRKRGAYLGTV